MFAIVDIETTGGSPAHSKIIEIAAVIHDGLSVVKTFSTLIDPECNIPYSITRLTGITDSMVRGAPKFYEIAKEFYLLTHDKIFIAHNVSFDYNFIRHEYESMGGEYSPKKLCTVQLSRKLIPGLKSYSLGNICNDLNIIVNGRHRAAGDAMATAKLFEILLEKKNEHKTLSTFNIDEISTPKLNTIRRQLIDKLPEKPGVYYFLNKEREIIYVGKSNNIKSRAISHLSNTRSKKGISMVNAVYEIDYCLTGSEMIALLMESDEIKKHKPIYNHAKKRSSFSHGITSVTNEDGYLCLKTVKVTKEIETISNFTTADGATNELYYLIEEFELCQKLCGLYETNKACFHYQVKKCNGACVHVEPPEEYNERVNNAINKLGIEKVSFALVDTGRTKEERSVVLIENGQYKGFGFVPTENSIRSFEEFESFITSYDDNRDIQMIIKSFIDNQKIKKIYFNGKNPS